MTRIIIHFLYIIMLVFPCYIKAQDIVFTEIKINVDENGEINNQKSGIGEGFIEIYNSSDANINLDGWKISIGNDNNEYVFPSFTIPSNTYLVLVTPRIKEEIPPTKNIKDNIMLDLSENILNYSSGYILLKNENGELKDSVNYKSIYKERQLFNIPNFITEDRYKVFELSLQRIFIPKDDEYTSFSRASEWVLDSYSLWEANSFFSNSAFNIDLIYHTKFTYDKAGNRISKIIGFKMQSPTRQALAEQETPEEYFFEEYVAENLVKIYPNPTKGELKLEISQYTDKSNIKIYIYNSNGQMIANKTVTSAITSFDLSNQANGMYIMKINIDGEYSSWKIIKE